MNKGGIVTVDDTPRNAGLFASVPRMYGSDGIEEVTRGWHEALWYIPGVGHTGLPLLSRFVRFLGGWGR